MDQDEIERSIEILQRELSDRDRRLTAARNELEQAAAGHATVVRIDVMRELLTRRSA